MLVFNTIVERNTLKEITDQVTDSFPFRTACSDIRDYPCRMFPWHWHEDAEILFINRGKLTVKVPAEEIVLSEGDIIFIPSNILHSSCATGDCPGIHKEFIFSPLFLGGSWNSILTQKYILPLIHRASNPIIIRAGSSCITELTDRLGRIFALARDEPECFELHIHQLLWDVWMMLLQASPRSSGNRKTIRSSQGRLYKMLAYIHNHFGEEITLAQIAQEAGISTRECNRSFRASFNITTMDYLFEYRINKACTMLLTTDDPVTGIGYGCGFSSAAYFTKRFRERLGVTPKEYRRANRQ